jgi:hypothetical protein
MIPYASPEWVAEVGKNYKANPDNQNKTFKGMNIFLTFRILADPKFGIDKDICFCSHLVNGALQDDSSLLSKEDAEKKSDFILSAPPEMWKKLIKKEQGFVSSFMTGKIKLDKGSTARIISLASKSGALIESFYKVDTEWPDEMSPQRLEEYKVQVKGFRERLKV